MAVIPTSTPALAFVNVSSLELSQARWITLSPSCRSQLAETVDSGSLCSHVAFLILDAVLCFLRIPSGNLRYSLRIWKYACRIRSLDSLADCSLAASQCEKSRCLLHYESQLRLDTFPFQSSLGESDSALVEYIRENAWYAKTSQNIGSQVRDWRDDIADLTSLVLIYHLLQGSGENWT